MPRVCTDFVGHSAFVSRCRVCGAFLCTLCNFGDQCGDGCQLPDVAPPPDLKRKRELNVSPPRKRKCKALTYNSRETRRVNTVRTNSGFQFYGYVRSVEPVEGKKDEITAYEVRFDCILASWFDALPDDFSGLDWSKSAQASLACQIEISVTREVLQQIISVTGGTVSVAEGTWLKLWLKERKSGVQGEPCAIYLPPLGNNNPGSIGIFGEVTHHYMLTRIERIRPTSSGQRLLRKFEEYIAENE